LKHIPRKRFGQHFLVDQGVIEQIIDAIGPNKADQMIEIGPGMGAMTQPLLKKIGHLCVIELDKDLVRSLELNPLLKVVSSDVLKVRFDELALEIFEEKLSKNPAAQSTLIASPRREAAQLRIVGNLPYNISTPILFHLLDFVEVVQDQHFMLQKEVVQRMVANPATADFGRLSVMLQWRYEMISLLDVEPDSFDPPPRVRSAVVKMTPRSNPAQLDFGVFQNLVQVAFSQRRKLLRHTLGRWLEERQFDGEFDLKRRAEEVSVAQYISLAQAIKK
jgi:16S rRNA (adenine1518-N6/adenine1519-N6)-dimethyltransferase